MPEYIVKETDCHFGTKQEIVGELIWKPEYNFCPNCGADMREGDTP